MHLQINRSKTYVVGLLAIIKIFDGDSIGFVDAVQQNGNIYMRQRMFFAGMGATKKKQRVCCEITVMAISTRRTLSIDEAHRLRSNDN